MAEENENTEYTESAEESVAAEEPVFEYCESCGIRLIKKEDHGGSDPKNTWCKDCCNPNGSHKTKEEIKKNVAKLFTKIDISKLLGESPAIDEIDKMAEDYLKRMPAWAPKEE